MVNLSAMITTHPIADDDLLALLKKENVYLTSGTGYRSEECGWFRVVIAHPTYVLDEGLERILRCLVRA